MALPGWNIFTTLSHFSARENWSISVSPNWICYTLCYARRIEAICNQSRRFPFCTYTQCSCCIRWRERKRVTTSLILYHFGRRLIPLFPLGWTDRKCTNQINVVPSLTIWRKEMKKLVMLGRCSYISSLAAGGSKRPSDFINLALEKLKNTKTRWLSSPLWCHAKEIFGKENSTVSDTVKCISLHRGVHLRIFGTNFWNALHAKNPGETWYYTIGGWDKKMIRFLVVSEHPKRAKRRYFLAFPPTVAWDPPLHVHVFAGFWSVADAAVCYAYSVSFLPVMQYHVVIFWVLSLHPRRMAKHVVVRGAGSSRRVKLE